MNRSQADKGPMWRFPKSWRYLQMIRFICGLSMRIMINHALKMGTPIYEKLNNRGFRCCVIMCPIPMAHQQWYSLGNSKAPGKFVRPPAKNPIVK